MVSYDKFWDERLELQLSEHEFIGIDSHGSYACYHKPTDDGDCVC